MDEFGGGGTRTRIFHYSFLVMLMTRKNPDSNPMMNDSWFLQGVRFEFRIPHLYSSLGMIIINTT
jgi:hypothetical protein